MLERLVKLALWSRGGFRIHLDAPAALVEQLRAHFRDSATGRFDSEIVGGSVYDHPIEVVATHELPPERAATTDARRSPRRLPHRLRSRRQRPQGGGDHRRPRGLERGDRVGSVPPARPSVPLGRDHGLAAPGGRAPAARRRDRRQRRRRLRRQPGEVRLAVPGRRARRLRAARQEHLPRPQACLARRPVRRRQRRRRHRAARVDVDGRGRCPRDRARHQHRRRLRHRRRAASPPGSTRSPSCPSTTAPTRPATSGRATSAAACSTCPSRRSAVCSTPAGIVVAALAAAARQAQGGAGADAGGGCAGAQDIYQTIGVYLGYALPDLASVYDFRHVLRARARHLGAGRRRHARHGARGATRRLPGAREQARSPNARREGQASRTGDRRRQPARPTRNPDRARLTRPAELGRTTAHERMRSARSTASTVAGLAMWAWKPACLAFATSSGPA